MAGVCDLLDKIKEDEADEFQETILRSINHHKGPYLVEVMGGITYWMFEECFDPAYAKAALLLMALQGVEEGDEVLVQFSGQGLDSRLAYERGASKVVSVEKFEMPWLCARYNTLRNGLAGRIDNRLGDLFEPIGEDEKFDLILANPPFRNMVPYGNVESAIRDENYETLKRFWSQVGDHLKPDGRIRAVFSDVGDMNFFYKLARENGFGWNCLGRDKYAARVYLEVTEFKLGISRTKET